MRAGTVVGIALVLLAAGSALWEPVVGRNGPATPEVAVALLVERSRAEDVEGVMDLLASPLRELTQFYFYQEANYIEPTMAMATRFPLGPIMSSGIGMGTWYDMRRLRSVEILRREVVDPGRVRMTVRETVGSFSGVGEDVLTVPYLAVRSAGEWRLYRPPVLLIGSGSSYADSKVEARPDEQAGTGWRCTITFHKDLDVAVREWADLMAQAEGRSIAELAETQRRGHRRISEVVRGIQSGEYDLHEQAERKVEAILKEEEERASPRRKPDAGKISNDPDTVSW